MREIRAALERAGFRPRHVGDGAELSVCPCCYGRGLEATLGITRGMRSACWRCDAGEDDVRRALGLPPLPTPAEVDALIARIGAVLRGDGAPGAHLAVESRLDVPRL